VKVYAGIGSRQTPVEMLSVAEAAAEALEALGWVLRSGHAPGADRAFESGAGRRAEVYLPWPSFERSEPLEADAIFDRPSLAAFTLAAQYHPAWGRLKRGPRALMARNMHQILGLQLDSPVKFVLCWTPNAAVTGGTGQAMRLALDRGIPIYNLAEGEHLWRVERMIESVRATMT
jgi:hypothetical protein